MNLSLGLSLGSAAISGGGVTIPIAPAIDQPIITSGAGGVSFATQTQHFAKRIGDNTTNVDTDGDTKFRYPGCPAGSLVPAAINARFVGGVMPGGVAQARRWDAQVEMMTTSKFVGMVHTPPGTPARLLLVVNGKWVSAETITLSAAAGSTSFVLLEFPDNRPRRIKFVFNGAIQVQRFETEASYPPVRPTGFDKTLAAIGDSLSAGSGNPPTGANSLDTWPQAVATLLGFDHCCNASIGGTKWVAGGAGDVAISHFGGDRLPMTLTLGPNAIVFAGSRNDTASVQADLDAITAAVQAAIVATSMADSRIFVAGTFTVLPQDPAVHAGALAEGATFIGMTDGLQPGDIGADTVHPTYAGAVALRNRFAPRLRAAGCAPV